MRDELLDATEGHVATLRINRPEQRNALSTELLEALAAAIEHHDRDPEVRCVVLAGSAKVFASGADLRALQHADPLEHYVGARIRAWATIRRARTPMVAAVSGFCLGGGLELAMSCAVIVAAESARFGQPETMLGLVPAAGATQRLPAAIGRAKALDMILTGRLLDAAEAERAGLVSRVVAQDAWMDEVRDVAAAIAARGPLAQRLVWETIEAASDVPFAAGLALERRAFAMALSSPQGQEGVTAFLERRAPDWNVEKP
ncbi:MAG TPA: enoyl-CoA hydratase-related protein [Baekduia sp.]|nr:enoyl-CoA hydratase-related protein [Baekduia sp.]